MKRALLPLFIGALLLLAGCAGLEMPVEFIETFSHDGLAGEELTVENEYLSLRFDCTTTQFSVTDKRTGKVWYSNPPDAKNDMIAAKSGIERLQSQLLVNYGQVNGTVTEINNYALSVANSAYSWELVENGIKVSYTLGRTEREFIVPSALTESRFMEYVNIMDSDQRRALNNYYRIIDLEQLKATDNREELLGLYPALESERMFVLRENLQKSIMDRLEGFFESVGYTIEDYIRDKAAVNSGEENAAPVFNVTVLYMLDGPEFVVTVPLGEIEYRSAYPILSLSVLPFFGAGGMEEEGFMLVPDASGAIINFNNGKQNQTPYGNALYGYDYALKRAAIVNDNAAYFPVFGVNHNEASFICVVEGGAENAIFEADVSGRLNSYNSVNTRYTVLNWDDVDISKANVYAKVFERKELSGALEQRYIFLDARDYVGMAVAYRDYLRNLYPSLTKNNETGLPIALGLIGAVDRTVNMMGVPVVVAYPLTTYSQASGIISDFAENGIDNLRVNLTGWFNGGVVHDAPTDISLISSLGGEEGFTELLDVAAAHNADLYMEADFTYIYDVGLLNGYQVNRDTAKRLSRDLARLYPYSFVWFGERTGNYGRRYSYYLATPEYTINAIGRFYSQLQELGGQNITFRDIGCSLNSDFNVKKPVSRQEAAGMQQAKMAELLTNGAKMMVHGGNIYAVPYAEFILDMELESKHFNIVDESVPFYQIALHGLVPYAGSPVNLATDYERAILKTVETGAGLQFLFMSASGEDIQDTNYTRYYASDIARWGSRPAELYQRLNGAMAHTVNLFITGHQKLAAQVYQTEYEDGTRVIVNYAKEPFDYEGNTVNGMDFLVIK